MKQLLSIMAVLFCLLICSCIGNPDYHGYQSSDSIHPGPIHADTVYLDGHGSFPAYYPSKKRWVDFVVGDSVPLKFYEDNSLLPKVLMRMDSAGIATIIDTMGTINALLDRVKYLEIKYDYCSRQCDLLKRKRR